MRVLCVLLLAIIAGLVIANEQNTLAQAQRAIKLARDALSKITLRSRPQSHHAHTLENQYEGDSVKTMGLKSLAHSQSTQTLLDWFGSVATCKSTYAPVYCGGWRNCMRQSGFYIAPNWCQYLPADTPFGAGTLLDWTGSNDKCMKQNVLAYCNGWRKCMRQSGFYIASNWCQFPATDTQAL